MRPSLFYRMNLFTFCPPNWLRSKCYCCWWWWWWRCCWSRSICCYGHWDFDSSRNTFWDNYCFDYMQCDRLNVMYSSTYQRTPPKSATKWKNEMHSLAEWCHTHIHQSVGSRCGSSSIFTLICATVCLSFEKWYFFVYRFRVERKDKEKRKIWISNPDRSSVHVGWWHRIRFLRRANLTFFFLLLRANRAIDTHGRCCTTRFFQLDLFLVSIEFKFLLVLFSHWPIQWKCNKQNELRARQRTISTASRAGFFCCSFFILRVCKYVKLKCDWIILKMKWQLADDGDDDDDDKDAHRQCLTDSERSACVYDCFVDIQG